MRQAILDAILNNTEPTSKVNAIILALEGHGVIDGKPVKLVKVQDPVDQTPAFHQGHPLLMGQSL